MRCGLRSSRPGMRVDWGRNLRPKAHIHHCSKRCAAENFQVGRPVSLFCPNRTGAFPIFGRLPTTAATAKLIATGRCRCPGL
jgi:hypothetical protein